MNIYAISDIHGEYDKLIKLIDKINPDTSDEFVFLGDYVDRGKNSKQVIKFLIELGDKFKCTFLLGNHEEMMLNALKNDYYLDMMLWKQNGGTATIKSYRGLNNILVHRQFLNSLKLYHETDKYFFVHAGIMPNVPLEKQIKDDMLWIRDQFIYAKETGWTKKIIYGHSRIDIFQPPYNHDRIGIDTGAAYGGPLTALKLPEEIFIQYG